ncbi:MAG: aldo/keto reductase [Gammaproteobacteria bacterium]|nr:aldo/keto reductase [Gammaproteobacteria bacterium]MDH3446933.1 aldo/keto reductase [Gammaproteobacteria bacterium]
MQEVTLPSGNSMPVIGLGTWRLGEYPERFGHEVDLIRSALDLGITLLDTAEMYGEGGAEEVIGEAIRGRRDGLFLVSKFYPHNASRKGVREACERSLRRMDCDTIDLYLLHWPGSMPLAQTFEALRELQEQGKIRDFGVSNFNLSDLQDIPETDQSRLGCNQVYYNLAHREVEWEVSGWCRERGIPVMAYSPLDQAGALLGSPVVAGIAEKHSATAAQVALAWLLHQPDTVAIPKSARLERIRENLDAANLELDAADLAVLDEAFPPPKQAVRLGMR